MIVVVIVVVMRGLLVLMLLGRGGWCCIAISMLLLLLITNLELPVKVVYLLLEGVREMGSRSWGVVATRVGYLLEPGGCLWTEWGEGVMVGVDAQRAVITRE